MGPSVAYRIGVDGKADTQRDFADIGASGDAMSARLVAGYERATAAADAAQRKLRDASQRLGAVQPASPVQEEINNSTGVTASGAASARDSASAFRELLTAQAAAAQKAELLRSQIDPLYAAQQRYNTAVTSASDLLKRGAISEAEHTAATKLAADALKAAEKAARDNAEGVGLNRMQWQELAHVVRSGGDAIAAGASPFRVLTMEGGRAYQALSSGEGGLAGGLNALGRYINPVTIGLGAIGGAMALGAKLALDYSVAQSKAQIALQYLGATSGASIEGVNQSAEATAAGAGVSVKAATDMELAFAKTGKIGSELFGGLVSVQRDYAAATGQSAQAATEALAKAFAEPVKGAADLTDQLHFLDNATLKQIEDLSESGERAEAQRILFEHLQAATAGASKETDGFSQSLQGLKNWFDNATQSAGRYFDKLAHGPSKSDLAKNARATYEAFGGGADVLAHVQQLEKAAADEALKKTDAMFDSAAKYYTGQRADRSRQVGSAIENLNPKQNQIDTIRSKQELARSALNNPDMLAASGYTKEQAEASIAAGDKRIAQLEKVTQHVDRHAQALARDAAAMELNTRGSWDLATAYQQGDTAALKAEATRKAMTDATKKGADVDAEVARQLALSIAQTAVAGAKRLADLKDETTARAAANDNVKAGAIAIGDLSASMSDEAELRPLLTALTAAQTTKIADQAKRVAELTGLIDAMRAAQQRAREEQAKSDYLQADAALDRSIGQTRLRLATIGDHTGARDVLAAGSKALQDGLDKHFSAPDLGAYYSKAVQDAQATQAEQLKERAVATTESQREQIDLAQRELDLVGSTVAQHDDAITRLKTEQQLKRDGLTLTSADGQTILANALKLDQVNRRLADQQAAWGELKQAGDQLIDDTSQLLNPESWDNWGDAGKRVLDDLLAEMIKLEIANPLKNALFNDTLPTGAGVFSLLGNLVGGGHATATGGTWFGAAAPQSLPGFASGTDDAPGGPAMVGEEGPEIVDLPAGAKVTPAGTTRDLFAALAGNNNTAPIHVELNSNLQVNGGSPSSAQDLKAILDARDREWEARLPGLMQDAISRRKVKAA